MLQPLPPILLEAQEANTDATARPRARIKIDFLIVKRYYMLKLDYPVEDFWNQVFQRKGSGQEVGGVFERIE